MTAAAARLPLRVRIAQHVRRLPDFRGRDRLLATLLRSGSRPDGLVAGSFGGGLRYEGNPAADANVLELVLLRFASPALAPVLDAALAPGAVFADVGANLGLYTLWAARIVGASGRVHAFEPVPGVRANLERNVRLNGFENVRCVAAGVGAQPGRVTLYQTPGASGVTSRYGASREHGVEVEVTTLDAQFPAAVTPPALVKVDVEGMEIDVLRGARALLTGARAPVLVLEANPILFKASGTSYADLRGVLAASGGYALYALRPDGLRAESATAVRAGSLNVLAARPELPAHARVLGRLARVRFARNMNA